MQQPEPPVLTGVALGGHTRPFPGQVLCGDVLWWRVADTDAEAISGTGRSTGQSVTLALIDGLGHGPRAYAAASAVVAALEARWSTAAGLEALLRAVHGDVMGQPGGSITLARYTGGRLEVTAVGNTVARVVGPRSSHNLLSPDGNLGALLPTPRVHRLDLPPGHALLCYSDGVKSQFDFEAVPGRHSASPAIVAQRVVEAHGKNHDDASTLLLRRAR